MSTHLRSFGSEISTQFPLSTLSLRIYFRLYTTEFIYSGEFICLASLGHDGFSGEEFAFSLLPQ